MCLTSGVQPPYVERLLDLLAGHGLLSVSGEEHRRMRKAMNQAFAMPNLMARKCFLSTLQSDSLHWETLICIMKRLKGESLPESSMMMLKSTLPQPGANSE